MTEIFIIICVCRFENNLFPGFPYAFSEINHLFIYNNNSFYWIGLYLTFDIILTQNIPHVAKELIEKWV